MSDMPTYAVDFETYYDKEYSLTGMSPWHYVHDPRFDAYLLAVHGDNGFHWVGHPAKFDWAVIKGARLLAHNAAFDNLVIERLRELGTVPEDCIPAEVLCTADMVAYLSAPRNLAGASEHLLGRKMDKTVRANMKGRTYQDVVNAGEEAAMIKYGGTDAENCYDLFIKYGDQWPQIEREYSIALREDNLRGMPVNRKLTEDSLQSLSRQLKEVELSIPWAGEKPILSYPTFRKQCLIDGLTDCPASLAKTDPDGNAFIEKHSAKFPWVKGFRDFRSLNAHKSKVATIIECLRPDDTMYTQIKYFGAHTGRTAAGYNDAAGDKFNMLNLPRKAMFGVDLRKLFVAPKGFVFGVVDYCQIEAIMLAWRVGDEKLLQRVRDEGNLYQAYARDKGWFAGKDLKAEDNNLYQRTKVSVLQLGYASGAPKFRTVAKTNYGVELTEQEALDLVNAYRNDNPKIVKLWADHQLHAAVSANHQDKTHEVVLKSGRVQQYFDPQWHVRPGSKGHAQREIGMRTFMGGPLKKVYGGLLTENEIQATARDVLRDARVACRKAGHQTVLDVYDEIVFLFPESEAKDRLADVARIMVSSSPWAEGCPLGVDAKLTPEYCK
jgi:DNA polymerase I-like protein with 3'-5' exonuclease and polymerase domains